MVPSLCRQAGGKGTCLVHGSVWVRIRTIKRSDVRNVHVPVLKPSVENSEVRRENLPRHLRERETIEGINTGDD